MKNLLTIMVLYLLLTISQAWSVPVCNGSPKVYKEGGNPEWNNCTGTLTWDGGSVTGKFIKGVLPYGTITFADGIKYVGEFKDEKFHGQGTLTYASGDKYVGEHKDGKQHGQGTYTFADGDKYVGEFKDDKYHGQGTHTYSSGDKYVGEWKDDERNGQGTYTFANGKKWVGQFKNDEWVNGKKYAAGEYNANSQGNKNSNKKSFGKDNLSSFYFAYLFIKECNNLSTSYIDSQNLQSAKKAIKSIENKYIKEEKNIDTDKEWRQATKQWKDDFAPSFTIQKSMGIYNADMQGMCRLYLTMLNGGASMIDADKDIEKDF